MAVLPLHIIEANQVASNKINPVATSRFNRDLPSDIPADPNQDEYGRLMNHVKKQKRRIDRYVEILKAKETEENSLLLSETRKKKLKAETILQETLHKIRYRMSVKDRIDEREKKKLDNKHKIENLEKVRLERSKLVPYVPEKVQEGEKNLDMSLTHYVEAKGSTKKMPLFREVSKAEIRKEFFAKVNKPTPKKVNSLKMTVAEKKRRKGIRYIQNNPDCQIVDRILNPSL